MEAEVGEHEKQTVWRCYQGRSSSSTWTLSCQRNERLLFRNPSVWGTLFAESKWAIQRNKSQRSSDLVSAGGKTIAVDSEGTLPLS